MAEPRGRAPPLVVGRYELYDRIAAGGMATVHIGRLRGEAGFARTVAIKRLLPQFARDPEFVRMFVDESRIAARIHHPNVAGTLDVVAADDELFLVMEYVHGESLASVLRLHAETGEPVPAAVVVGIVTGVLYGLHAAHEARTEAGEPLRLVHRDVSPQNILIGVDGVARVLDFGVAKATARLQITQEGTVKGKVRYMSPEQVRQRPLDRRCDLFAASVVLWEALTGKHLFPADDTLDLVAAIVSGDVSPPSASRAGLSPALDAAVLRGLRVDAEARFTTAKEMALALEAATAPASAGAIADWLARWTGEHLEARARRIAEIEAGSSRVDEPLPVSLAPRPAAIATDVRRRAEAPTDVLHVGAAGSPDARARDPNTQVSTVRDAPVRSPRRRGRLVWAALALLSLAAASWLARARSESGDALPDPAATPASGETMQGPASIGTTSEAPSPVAGSVRPELTAEPTTAVSAPATPSARAVPAPRLRPPSDCDPPYRWDPERRIRVFKQHCLR